ncbi:MAG: hypothetical protein RIT45_2487 [Pseudomonadota bacterium]
MSADWRAHYPFEPDFIDIGGQRLHLVDVGPGSPRQPDETATGGVVVMLHGNPTWSFYYRELIGELRRDHRCIAPDWIGCGLSDKPGADAYPYTLESRVDELERVLAERYPEGPLTLVVHDWGGMIGTAWAHRHPERVQRFVVMNTAGFPMPEDKRFPAALALVRTGLGAWLVQQWNGFAGVAARVGFKKPVDPAIRAGFVAPYDTPAHRVATLRFVQDIPLAAGDPGYEIVAETGAALSEHAGKPALICWGELDFVFDAPFLRAWQRVWPHAEVHAFPNAGHYVLEDEKATIVPMVRAFFERTRA